MSAAVGFGGNRWLRWLDPSQKKWSFWKQVYEEATDDQVDTVNNNNNKHKEYKLVGTEQNVFTATAKSQMRRKFANNL